MFIRSRSSLENHTRFQTKMGKVYSRFQTKKAQKPYPWGRHIPIWLIKESKPQPPPPPPTTTTTTTTPAAGETCKFRNSEIQTRHLLTYGEACFNLVLNLEIILTEKVKQLVNSEGTPSSTAP